MNRTLVLGIAIFLAVVGIALFGGQTTEAVAGHGCHGCHGCSGCAGYSACSGCHSCSGFCHGGFLRRIFRCHGCHGCSGCYGSCHGGCYGGGCAGGEVHYESGDGEVPPPAPNGGEGTPPPAPATEASFTQISFVR